jgi:hypothetical protein
MECNNVVKALPQLAAPLHDLIKPMVLAARCKNVTADNTTAEVQGEQPAHSEEAGRWERDVPRRPRCPYRRFLHFGG